jgi:hypothetical protein
MLVKIKIKAQFKEPYSSRIPIGTPVRIDCLRGDQYCRTGIMCRVVNIWSKPIWLDAGWFKF